MATAALVATSCAGSSGTTQLEAAAQPADVETAVVAPTTPPVEAPPAAAEETAAEPDTAAAPTSPPPTEAPVAEEPATEEAAPDPAVDDAPDAVVEISLALPEVEVHDLKTGSTANLASFARPSQATLVWFWAPH